MVLKSFFLHFKIKNKYSLLQNEIYRTDAQVVIIPAGVPRKPGMSRDDLFNVNAGVVKAIAESISRSCPKALVGIITNPVNSCVPIAAEVLKKVRRINKQKN